MKFKKTICVALSLTAITSPVFISSCKAQQPAEIRSVVSIEKTANTGYADVYTITYSDGTTYNFEIETGIKEDELTVCNKALLSSLKVHAEFTLKYEMHGGSIFNPTITYYNETALSHGSAVIYSVEEDYTYLITNYHVIYNYNSVDKGKIAKKITCYLYGSESKPEVTSEKDASGCSVYDYGKYALSCEYVGGTPAADLAVVRTPTRDIKAVNPDVESVNFATGYYVGQKAIAIGNSENGGISVTGGLISVDNESITYAIDGKTRYIRCMRIDTAIYSGNSGGGLFDKYGNLIGITNAGDKSSQNINFAIPVNTVKPVVENIMAYGNGSVKILDTGLEVEGDNSR